MDEQVSPVEAEGNVQPEIQSQAADMELIAAVANRLVAKNVQYSRLVASMLASRQLYAMCLYELERLCEETDFKRATKVDDEVNLNVGKTLTDAQSLMLKEVLINAAAMQAQQPFEENQLFDGMLKVVFPWMRDVVAKHNDTQAKLRKEAFAEAEQARVAKPVGLGLPITSDQHDELLNRAVPLLVVGERKLVNWVRDYVLTRAATDGSNVRQIVRLCSAENSTSDNPKIQNLAASLWADCTASNEAFQRVYEQHILPQLNQPIDLLLVDDVRLARKGLDFASMQTTANEAQKRLKRWAEKAGCLLISFVPMERQLKDRELNLPEYETLRVHNILRGVASEKITKDNVEHHRIYVGTHEIACVPSSELDQHIESKIVVS